MKSSLATIYQQGYALLAIAITLLVIVGIATLYAANIVNTEHRVAAHDYRTKQAFEAAEAGLNYGLAYLHFYRTSILVDSNSDGAPDTFSPPTPTKISLASNCGQCAYRITYTLPTAADLSLVRISSEGWSDDASSTNTIVSTFKFLGYLNTMPNALLTVRGNISSTGSSTYTNTVTTNGQNLQAGGTVDFGGSSKTYIKNSSGVTQESTNATVTASDVTENDTSLSRISGSGFFVKYFGESETAIQSSADYVYTNGSALHEKQNVQIWVNPAGGTLSLTSNMTIGSPTQPVALIVNGNLNIAGIVNIYGLLYTVGDMTVSGAVNISGVLLVQGNYNCGTGNSTITYSPTIVTNMNNQVGQFARVPGSWRDF